MYRRQATSLHAARAAAGAAYCVALAVVALFADHPLVLAATVLALLAAGAGARCGHTLRRALAVGLPLALAITVVNALVTRNGLTVLVRLGDLPVLGHTDITLEATVYGAILGLRAVALLLCGALYSAAVDPDEMLWLFRRVAPHSALSATIATRMVPVLLRDSRRLADAQRCRPGRPPGRATLLRAAVTGVFDRALDVAAALELRGYALASRRPPRTRPWSRHDLAFLTAAATLCTVAITARGAGWITARAYPSLNVTFGAATFAVAALILLISVLPFVERRGVQR